MIIPRTQDDNISRALNGNVEFGDPESKSVNIRGVWVNMTTGGANVEFTVTHNLGYVPSIMLYSADKAAHIYASRRTSWTSTLAYFKSDQASVPFVGFVF